MAIFKGGAGGVLSGMVGEIVVVTSKSGRSYLRRAPRKHKFSDKQKQNWKRFSALSSFWKKFEGSPIQQIWKTAQEGRRGINLFINANAPAFSPEGELIEMENLHFSSGQLPLPRRLRGEKMEQSKLQITWDNSNGNNLSRSDDELLMIKAKNAGFIGPESTGITRRQESAVINLEEGITGVFVFFGSEKRKMYSPDVFIEV